MGNAKMTRPKYDRQGDLLGYQSVDAAGFGYDNQTPIMMSDGMIDVSPAQVFGFDDPAIDQMIENRAMAPNQNPYLEDVQKVFGDPVGVRTRGPLQYESDVTVGRNSNLNQDQQAALLRGDTDAAILAGRR
jgi:hypothetical protein